MAVDAPDFRLLFEQSPDVLLVLLPDAPRFTMIAATEARLAATHTTREQTIGVGLFELFPDNPNDPAATGMHNLRASLMRVLDTRRPDTMAVQKYDIRGPDGTFQTKYWSPKNIPILSAAGEVQFIQHCVEDVTDLVRASEIGEELRDRTREMEREVIARSRELAAANSGLREANARLGELDAAKTAFFSNVSHEFRTPLTLMLGPLEDALADRTTELDPQLRERLALAHDNAMRLLKLVNALLDFSRLEAGRMQAAYAPIDLCQFTTELVGMFQSAIERAGLTLHIDCPPLTEPVWVDREMWEKIVPNLVSNALKFTTAGEIAVRVRDHGDRVVLEVSDTGIGIPEADLPRIFERFHRVAGAAGRTHEGTGIGLSLVRELVTLHGGDVVAQSEVGRGTTFRVTIPKGFEHLPADAVSQAPMARGIGRDGRAHAIEAARWGRGSEPAREAPIPVASADHGARPRVLIVDDNADLQTYMAGLLGPTYDVTVTADGVAALDAVRAQVPDLVVSDVMMPRLDGFGLVRELRSDPRTATVPVILVSARAGEESAIEGLDSGADDYLVKPFSARELIARVRTHIGLARSRRAWMAELEQTNHELDAFSYSVSHDLRAPLRAIEGFSRALAEDYAARLDATGLDYIDRIGRGVTRMAALIDALLDLARIARTSFTIEPVDLSALAADVVADLRRGDPDRAVTVTIADGLVALGDRRLLNVVLVNLIGNAWKFTARRGEAQIAIGAIAAEVPTYYVRDNGAGFDMAYASRLFGAFQRLHGANDFPGTGIGLATVQRVLSRHHGRIWADAAVGQGATFFFSLPAADGSGAWSIDPGARPPQ